MMTCLNLSQNPSRYDDIYSTRNALRLYPNKKSTTQARTPHINNMQCNVIKISPITTRYFIVSRMVRNPGGFMLYNLTYAIIIQK